MFTIFLYILATVCLLLSFIKSREKTKKALLKAWKSFENILPQFLSIIIAIGIMLTVVDTQTIMKLMGESSGMLGVIIASLIGAITLIPGFVAFPLAAALFESGAGVMQIAAFVSALMMVGIITLPLEFKTFGKKAAIIRNISAFVFSICVALAMGVIL
ncbi:MAG: permease [Clostridia bacterium]